MPERTRELDRDPVRLLTTALLFWDLFLGFDLLLFESSVPVADFAFIVDA